MDFPKYARSADCSVFYHIHSEKGFHEWKRIGMTFIHTEMKVKDYMDGVYVTDLMSTIEKGDLIEMSAEDFAMASLQPS